jgi:hypothetical protein
MPTILVRGTNSVEKGLTTRVLDPREIVGMWPWIGPLIEKVVEASLKEYAAEDVFRALLAGHMTAFVAEQGGEVRMVCVMEMQHFPQFDVANILIMAGKDFKAVRHFQPALEAWALAMGAVEIRGWMLTESRARLFRHLAPDFRRGYVMLRHDLRRSLQ